MRKRLLACLIFGATGVAAALLTHDRLGIGPIPSIAGGLVSGILVGYLVSVFIDVFQSDSSSELGN